jgi:hypothetical protein
MDEPAVHGTYVSLTYGTVILSFMSGVLWGFATKAEGQAAALGYALSVIPALWAFFMVNGDPGDAAVNLFRGLRGVVDAGLDLCAQGLTPSMVDALAGVADGGGSGMSGRAHPV